METFLIIIAVVVAIYWIVAGMIARLARPWRLELAEVGTDLIGRADVPEETKTKIKALMDCAFDAGFMVHVVIDFPLDAYRILKLIGRTDLNDGQGLDVPRDLASLLKKAEGRRFMMLMQRSLFAANPLFTLIYILEAIPFIILAVLLGGSLVLARAMQPIIERAARSSDKHAH